MEKVDDCGGGGSGGAGAGADADTDLVSSEAATSAPAAAGGGTRGAGADGSEMEGKNTAEGEPKVKRKMKTAFQLETLEKTYAGICDGVEVIQRRREIKESRKGGRGRLEEIEGKIKLVFKGERGETWVTVIAVGTWHLYWR